MKVLGEAESRLFALDPNDDIPKPLKDFLIANKDKGCHSCWFSSKMIKQHPECSEKINRWFDTRQKLMSFARELDNGNVVN